MKKGILLIILMCILNITQLADSGDSQPTASKPNSLATSAGSVDSENNENDQYVAIIQAKQDAELAAKQDKLIWYGSGLFGSCLGVGVAYMTPITVDPAKLMGKSPEYITFYSSAYRESIRAQRVEQATIGCVISGALQTLFVIYSAF